MYYIFSLGVDGVFESNNEFIKRWPRQFQNMRTQPFKFRTYING